VKARSHVERSARERVVFARGALAAMSSGACLLAALGALAACGGARSPGEMAHDSPIARIHRARCGNCHQRIEPNFRTRAELEPALLRHRKRVHLSDDEWDAMVDYLAPQERRAAAEGTEQAH
jgi:hypothetical protein